jgi:small-conductance mechanosensitive channel
MQYPYNKRKRMKKATKPKARMYKIGDWYTSNKAGVVGQIEKITEIRPDLTRVAIRTPFNEYRLLTVKVTA